MNMQALAGASNWLSCIRPCCSSSDRMGRGRSSCVQAGTFRAQGKQEFTFQPSLDGWAELSQLEVVCVFERYAPPSPSCFFSLLGPKSRVGRIECPAAGGQRPVAVDQTVQAASCGSVIACCCHPDARSLE